MKRLKVSCLVLVVIFFNQVNAQDFGFNGKKNTISLFSTGGIRVFPIILGYSGIGTSNTELGIIRYNSKNQMKEKTVIARYDLRFSYTRLLNKKFGFGAEFGYEKFSLPLTNFDSNGFVNKQSTPVFDIFSTMLVFEFHAANQVAPISFSSSIGIGPKIYKFNFDQNYRYSEILPMIDPYPQGSSDLIAINIFYQLNYKKVLNRFMTFDIGMRVHTGVILTAKEGYKSKSEYGINQLRDELLGHNLASILSLRTGFSFLL